jgi:DNA-binding CsgD family transcriptional regulator/transcriptional regulator with GAF, ATPase, and Fis domain
VTEVFEYIEHQNRTAGDDASALPFHIRALTALQQALLEITQSAMAASPGPGIYQSIVDIIPQVTNYDASTFSIYEGNTEGFKVVSHSNLSTDWVNEVRGNEMRIHSEQLEQIFKHSKRPLTFSNFDEHPISSEPKSRTGLPGMMMFPVQISQQNWGVLTFQTRRLKRWSEAEVAWVSMIGKHCELLIVSTNATMEAHTNLIRQTNQFRKELRTDIIALLDRQIPFEKYYQLNAYNLTTREKDVLALISIGTTNQEISQRLNISMGTVKKHVHSLLGKLDLKNRTQVASFARQLNLDTSRFFRD